MKLGCYMPIFGGWIRGKQLEEPEVTFEYVKNAVLKAEKIGFNSIWVADHLINPLKGETTPCLEAWTTLTALALLTKRVKLAHTTICQGFRYPAVLAKMSATLSEISKGRFFLSIGAGWFKREFESYGAQWFEHDQRVDRTREQIEIIKSFWTEDVTNYQGSYFTIKNGILEPKPQPIPEIWYGGESKPSKQLIADLCDGWLMYDASPEETKIKIDSMNVYLKQRKIQNVASAHVIIAKSDEKALEKLKKVTKGNENIVNHIRKTGLVGSPETITNRINDFEESGVDQLLLKFSQTVKDLEIFEKVLLN